MNQSWNLCIPCGIASAARILTAETPSCQHRLRGLQLMFSLETCVSFEFTGCIPCAPWKNIPNHTGKQTHFYTFLMISIFYIKNPPLNSWLPNILSRGRAEVRFSSFGRRPEAWAPHGFHQVGSQCPATSNFIVSMLKWPLDSRCL